VDRAYAEVGEAAEGAEVAVRSTQVGELHIVEV
jgi:hypothetical protein